MRYRGRLSVLGVILGLTLVPVGLASCGKINCQTSMAAPTPTSSFVGQLTAVKKGVADYAVESVRAPVGNALDPHTPAVGTTIGVAYFDGNEKFLRVGERYRVDVSWHDRQYQSDIHDAESCGGGSGTIHADGSGIDTASVSWWMLHRALVGLALAPLVALVILSAWLWSRRRRRPEPVRVDDRYL